MAVTATSDITERTISDEGVRALLAGTPMASYADRIMALAEQYAIDPNWALSYIRWENGFGVANGFSLEHNNIWDILCLKGSPGVCGNPQNWGASDCRDPGNGYCYAVYPTMSVGLEAGFRLWHYYVSQGWRTWESSLAVALCGNLGCTGDPWVRNVIATGAANAERWPYSIVPIPPIPLPDISSPTAVIFLMGVTMFIAGSAWLWRDLHARV